jgi:hypothetical protein
MPPEADDRYLRYVVARTGGLSQHLVEPGQRVGLMRTKTEADWERFFHVVQESDPHHHLRSIHNCFVMYDHSLPLGHPPEHPRSDVERTDVWRRQYGKPVVIDECLATRAISLTAGATLPPRRWCAASGSLWLAAAMAATARPTSIRKRFCGGPRAACSTARARRASPFCRRHGRLPRGGARSPRPQSSAMTFPVPASPAATT